MGTSVNRRPLLGPQLIAVATVVLVIVVLLLDWVSGGGSSEKFWRVTASFGHRPPIFLFIGVAIVLALAAAYLAGQTQLRPWLGTMGLILFGYVLEISLEWGPLSGSNGVQSVSNSAVGPWIALVAGLVIAVGAALTLELRASALSGLGTGLRQAAGNVSAAAQSRASAAGAAARTPNTASSGPVAPVAGTGAASGGATAATPAAPAAGETPATSAVGAAATTATPAVGADATTATPAAGAGASTEEDVSPKPVADPDETTDIGSAPPPGWYPDPSGQHKERLWDGSNWTDDVR